MLCKCGCGREAGTKNGRKLKYHSPDCYPPAKKLAASKSREPTKKLCDCGCGRWFEDSTPQRQRKFHSKQCQYNHWQKNNGENRQGNTHLYSDAGKHYRDVRAKICNRDGKLCANYRECSDSILTHKDGAFKYQANGGVDCYKKPDSIYRVNSPNSIGVCSVNVP